MLGFQHHNITASPRQLLGRRGDQDIATPLATSHHEVIITGPSLQHSTHHVDRPNESRPASQTLLNNGPIATRNPLAGTSLPDKSANTLLCFWIIADLRLRHRESLPAWNTHTNCAETLTRSSFAAGCKLRKSPSICKPRRLVSSLGETHTNLGNRQQGQRHRQYDLITDLNLPEPTDRSAPPLPTYIAAYFKLDSLKQKRFQKRFFKRF